MSQRADTVVVTGGAGFIGSHLVDRLLADTTAQVVVFDNLARGRLANLAAHRGHPRLTFTHGDLRDRQAVHAVLRGARVVYHLGARATVMGGVEDPEATFETNVVGTFHVLRSAAQHGVERVLFTSCGEVYGEPISLPVDEASPLAAINTYGASKVAGEALCRAFRREHGLHASILRLTSVYGTRDVGRVIPRWFERARDGQHLDVFGGKQVMDFVWVGQAVDALVRAAALESPLPPTNVGSGTGTRIVDLARRIARLAQVPGQVRLLPARPMEVTRFVANVDRMRTLLKIEPPLDPLGQLPGLLAAGVPRRAPAGAGRPLAAAVASA